MWNNHYNRFPRKEYKRISFIELQYELNKFGSYEKKKFRQIKDANYANCHIFRLADTEVGVGFGLVPYNESHLCRCWKFGTEEEWNALYETKVTS